MRKAVYPGSFDPVTNGHLDIIERAASKFDILYVAVLENSGKKPLFTVNERLELLEKATKDINNVKCVSFDGLLVQFAERMDIDTVIRGLRAVTDFEYEFQMALTNKNLYPRLDTIFIPTNLIHMYTSSSIVKEIAKYRGNFESMVTEDVKKALEEKFSGKEEK
ncbi:MAG: pantetheine-phosphate adenylyltransferase [Firmicutes bacterium]|nr:pantetheine-phosphate adenylyltransferase [Bacillota bacterium]